MSTIKVIRLELKQTTANYRKPLNYQIKESYPLPPFSTVIGMVHKACGFKEYHPMKVSIQGMTNNSINDIYTQYTFSKGAKCEKDRKDKYYTVVKVNGKDNGIIKGIGNIELLQDINLIIHIKPDNDEELEYIYNKLKSPDVYLSLGRYEDLIDINKISIDECKIVDETYTKVPIYIPLEVMDAYGTIFNLSKVFSINTRTGLRQFEKPIRVSLHEKGKELEDVYVDSSGYPVILC